MCPVNDRCFMGARIYILTVWSLRPMLVNELICTVRWVNIIISLPPSTLLNLVMFTSCLTEEQSSADSLSKTFKVNSNKMKLKVRNNNPPFLTLLTLA